jgi:hypothetical protein
MDCGGRPELTPEREEMAMAQTLPGGAIRSALAIYALTLLAYSANILYLTAPGSTCCLVEDSASYLSYWQSELYQFRRTPAYPAFITAIEVLFGGGLRPLLLSQAALQALVPAFVVLLSRCAWPDRPGLAMLAGLCCGASFVGVGMSHQVLSESLFTFLSMGALTALFIGVRAGQRALLWTSVLAAGLALLTRPNFIVFLALFPVLALLFAGRTAVLRQIALPTLVLALFPLTLGAVNQIRFGAFTLSSISAETAAVFWGARTLAAARDPDPQVYRYRGGEHRDVIWQKALRIDDLGARNAFYSQQAREIVAAHPSAALSAFATSLAENAPQPFDGKYLDRSLYQSLLPALKWLHQVFFIDANTLYYLGLALGLWRLLAERQFLIAIALLGYAGALWATTGISFWQGARLMYPAEPVLAILFAWGASWACTALAAAWASRRIRLGEQRATAARR